MCLATHSQAGGPAGDLNPQINPGTDSRILPASIASAQSCPPSFGPINALATDVVQPDLADSLIEFWIRGRSDGGLPDREYFDACNLKPWLGHLSIYERVGKMADFRCRLEGTKVVALTGESWFGRFASDVDGRFEGGFLQDLRSVAVWKHPARSLCRIFQKPRHVAERVLLPITLDGTTVDQVVLGLFPMLACDPPCHRRIVG